MDNNQLIKDPETTEAAKVAEAEKVAEAALAKQMAEKVLEAMEDKIERNIKDSVFCDLFKDPNNILSLYQVLYPDDKTTTVDDLTLITLSRVIVKTMFNDLGFIVGNRLIVLVEAQSTWTENIVVRYLEYIAETYRRYILQNGMNVYSSTKVKIPVPELYVLYTGDCQPFYAAGPPSGTWKGSEQHRVWALFGDFSYSLESPHGWLIRLSQISHRINIFPPQKPVKV